MAKGIIGHGPLTANTWYEVYNPVSVSAVVNINVVNKGSSATTITLVIDPSTPGAGVDGGTDGYYLEYQASVASHDVLERTAVMLQDGYSIWAFSPSSDVDVLVYGVEGTT